MGRSRSRSTRPPREAQHIPPATLIIRRRAMARRLTSGGPMRSFLSTLTAIASLAVASALSAQDAPSYAPHFNLSTYAGASIPTGDLRDSFDTGFLLGGQGTYDLNSHLGVLGNFDWTHPTT